METKTETKQWLCQVQTEDHRDGGGSGDGGSASKTCCVFKTKQQAIPS